MFQIPNHETFMTTIGKLNFFRWALESNILEYMEAHEDEIRKGYNSYLKETVETQKRNKSEANLSAKSTTSIASEASVEGQPILNINVARTTRRRTKQSPSSLNKLQVYNTPVVLDFN
jgi:hypothetical protein